MFSGITDYDGVVESHIEGCLCIVAPQRFATAKQGASIAVNGTCLTLAKDPAATEQSVELHFDVSPETYRLTNLANLKPGDKVNIERSLQVGDELGGHAISGHVHHTIEVAEIRRVGKGGAFADMRFAGAQRHFLIEKGFVALDGASITVGELTQDGFWVHLIPETLQRSRLGDVQVGDKVNIEYEQATVTAVTAVERFLKDRNE